MLRPVGYRRAVFAFHLKIFPGVARRSFNEAKPGAGYRIRTGVLALEGQYTTIVLTPPALSHNFGGQARRNKVAYLYTPTS
nr:hypothetical protein [uncultured bacterium]